MSLIAIAVASTAWSPAAATTYTFASCAESDVCQAYNCDFGLKPCDCCGGPPLNRPDCNVKKYDLDTCAVSDGFYFLHHCNATGISSASWYGKAGGCSGIPASTSYHKQDQCYYSGGQPGFWLSNHCPTAPPPPPPSTMIDKALAGAAQRWSSIAANLSATTPFPKEIQSVLDWGWGCWHAGTWRGQVADADLDNFFSALRELVDIPGYESKLDEVVSSILAFDGTKGARMDTINYYMRCATRTSAA